MEANSSTEGGRKDGGPQRNGAKGSPFYWLGCGVLAAYPTGACGLSPDSQNSSVCADLGCARRSEKRIKQMKEGELFSSSSLPV